MTKNTIEFETTKKDLTHLSGLVFYQKLIKSISLDGIIGKILPPNKSIRGQTNKEKFFTAVYSFIAGSDCIEDLEMMKQDPLFYEVANSPCSAVTMGRFRDELPRLAFKLREKLYPTNQALILSMDSTPHEQYGPLLWVASSQGKHLYISWCGRDAEEIMETR